jgi:putative ABC transport system permease protein
MLKNYLVVALRNLRRQKGYAFITISGLALGLACSLLIALFVRHEASYDRFHERADRIYRLTYELVNTAEERHLATTAPPMGPALAETFPEVERFVRLREAHPSVVARGDTRFYESDFFYADSAFFETFSFPLRAGDPATALDAVNTVVLTAETAQRYFGDEDPLGQVLTMNDELDLTVTGVMEPIPAVSHLRFDFLVSFATFRVPHGYPVTLDDWRWSSFHTYVLLTEDADPRALEAQFPAFLRANLSEEQVHETQLHLQPLTDIYLGQPQHPAMAAGNPTYLYGLGSVAVLLLLLACFNFTNLATAHAIRRGKEVGIRKAIGAHRGQLARQFLGEAVLVALAALVVAAFLVGGALNLSESLVGWTFAWDRGSLALLALPVLLAVGAGLAAGSYPAFVLSRSRPARALKGETTGLFGHGRLRGTLVVLQFAIAVALIAGSLVVGQQMRFIQEKELGFDREQVVALHALGPEIDARYPAMREALLQNPRVLRVTKGGHLFDGDQGSVPMYPEGTGGEALRRMSIYSLYYDFVETLGLEVVAGRAPSEAFASDSSAIMLNEAAAAVLAAELPGWENPVGKRLRVGDIMEGEVVGVVEDFHYASLHAEIEPLVLHFPRAFVDKVFVRVRPSNAADLLASLERDWARVAPDLPFHYTFLDDHVQQLYRADERFARLTTLFTILTLVVAALGLYGLVAFVTQRRTKEIGVRKVLGASVQSLVALLSKQFLLYVLLANLLAWPLAYVAMDRWLDGFAYRVGLGPGAFVLAGLATVVLALAAMSAHTLRAATANPVTTLRTE